MKRTTSLLSHFVVCQPFLRRALSHLAVLAFVAPPVGAAVTEAWVQRYRNVVSISTDEARKVVRDAAGDVIVTGTTYESNPWDSITIKYSGTDGSMIWQKHRPGDVPRALAVDGSGNVVVTGGSVTKYASADGALLWEKRYDGPANFGSGSAVAVDGSGNVVVTGYSTGNGSSYDYYTAKYASADGALLWEKRYNGPANSYDVAQAVAVDGSGNVVVTGYSPGNGSSDDFYTAKYASADGALLWEKRYNGPANSDDYAYAMAVDGSGNVVVTGSSENGTTSDYYTAKYAAVDGALLWENRYNGPANGDDGPSAVAVDGDGNVVVTGYSQDSSGLNADAYTAKYAAADGALLWEKRYNGPANSHDFGSAIAMDGGGNVVVTGDSVGGGYGYDYYTAKYAAADGALLWERRYDGPANNQDLPRAVAVDGSGNAVVTGSSVNRNGNADYYTAKYAAADGDLLWEKRYDGPAANSYNSAQAVGVDSSGNVVVTGYYNNGSGDWTQQGRDYYTARYASADGSLLWEQRYNGPENGSDGASAVAVDGGGNVVVTGYSINGDFPDYYTARYAAADGALLWEKRYDGPGNYEDRASAVAVDSSGNVVVTGYSNGGAPYYNSDYYTAKYAAADGALLWEKRHPRSSDDEYGCGYAVALAVDGSGNVVVTGYTLGLDGCHRYTARYASADGGLLWEKYYNSGAIALAVDGSGNVVATGPYNTAKYAAADGALLWEKSSEGGGQAVTVDASGNVVATGSSVTKYASADGALLWEKPNTNRTSSTVAVDNSGNVVVTGTSRNDAPGNDSDYSTAKYAAADGALLWEKRYNGPGNGSDNASGLALGPNGMVVVTGSSSGDFATVVYREIPPPLSFADWAAGFGLKGAAGAGDADPDSDGLPSGAEYILGTNPAVPDTSGLPSATVSGDSMVFTFTRADESETPDVTLTVESGTDLLTWPAVFNIGPNTTASSSGVSINENGSAPDTITVTIPQSNATRLFARLKVSIGP